MLRLRGHKCGGVGAAQAGLPATGDGLPVWRSPSPARRRALLHYLGAALKRAACLTGGCRSSRQARRSWRFRLERALALNPASELAARALARLNGK